MLGRLTNVNLGSPPPALVRSLEDIDHFTVGDAQAVGASRNAQSPYSERFIHAGVFAAIPDAISVVHSHSQDVVAQADSGVPLQPLWHMAGFLGVNVPVFDPEDVYNSSQAHNLLVNTPKLGSALGSMFVQEINEPASVVLQRGHGFTTWGKSIEQTVYRAVYTQDNARIQKGAMDRAMDQFGNAERVQYLSAREVADAKIMSDGNAVKSWPLWKAQVDANPLYKNNLENR